MQSPQPYAVFRSIAKVHLVNADDLDFVFLGLGSLLTGVTPASADPIQPLHTSFREFILDTTQSQPFSLGHDLAAAHAEVAYACLRIMNDPMEGLRFNVCSLSRSFILKKHIQDLEQRVFEYISPGLQYACRQGGAHFSFGAIRLSGTSPSPCFSRIHRELTVLLKRNFLFWLETCGYMSIGHILSKSLETFLTWALKSDLTDLYNFISDCIEFKTHFSEAISQSPPQVYLSGLAFAPRQSRVGKLYRNRFFIPVRIAGYGGLRDWPVVTEPSANIYVEAPTRPRRFCVFSLAYSPNGRHIALGLNNSVGVWDRESPGSSRLEMFHFLANPRSVGAVEGIAFTPNGRFLASSAMDGIIRLWDMRTPERFGEFNRWYPGGLLAFSPDSKYMAMASRLNNLMLWDLEHNRCIAKAGAQAPHCIGRIQCMAYSPEGSYIACGTSRGAMWLWNLKTALLFEAGRTTFETRNSAIVSVVFSPNGKTVASISKDSTLQHWDMESQQYLHLPYNPALEEITCVAISSNGKFIAVGLGCGTLRIWDAETLAQVGHDLVGDEERIRSVAFSPDSARVASRSTVVRIWDVETQRQHGDDFRLSSRSYAAHCMVFSPDGRCIVSGFSDGTVRTWDTVENCQVGDHLRLEEVIVCIALSPDGLLIACGSMDGVLRICSVVWGQQIWSIAEDGDSGPIVSVAFSSDGARIAYCSRSAVHLVDMDTRMEVGRYVHSNVRSVAFALDDTHIVFGGSHHYAGVWNPAKEGEEACVALYGHRGDVTGVATTRQGTTIVTCSSDSTIRLWDLAHLTSLSRNGAEPISESDLATERRQLHTRQIGGWLYHDRLSRFGDPPLDLKENWASDESCAPFLWIPPRIRRFFPSVYSPFARGVISAYPSFTVSLDNDECLDQWAITYTPPPDHMMEQEMEEDEGEGVVDAV
ncbi:WD40 repeat-like protein [Schizophyllum commune Tattone D]|nr:WD40 repeat-like protein [Schizophyllum commune Tattone D]